MVTDKSILHAMMLLSKKDLCFVYNRMKTSLYQGKIVNGRYNRHVLAHFRFTLYRYPQLYSLFYSLFILLSGINGEIIYIQNHFVFLLLLSTGKPP